ncbi:hypothetical protein ZWY2020_034912 [Hordeum vulgare]|nr:hypothetical protein ZWY2020_034912 [Hordeum vulgare]
MRQWRSAGENQFGQQNRRRDLAVHVDEVKAVEWEVAGGEHEEHHAADQMSPLAGRASPRGSSRDERGCRRGVEAPPDGAEPEVGDLKLTLAVEQQILRLDVAVVDAARVAVPDGGDELAEVMPREVLRHAAVGVDEREELAAEDIDERYVHACMRQKIEA